MNHFISITGLLAGVLTTLAFLPQVFKVWKSRSTKDISLLMYITFCAGLALWILYGVFLHSSPLVIANGITLALALSILIMKLLWK